jgi:hypothetical protein
LRGECRDTGGFLNSLCVSIKVDRSPVWVDGLMHISHGHISRRITQIWGILVIFLSGFGTFHLQTYKLSQLGQKATQQMTKDEYLHEESQVQAKLTLLSKIPSSSYDNLISDWAFLSFLQYFGDDQARLQTGYRIAPDFFTVSVNKDPLFLGMYPYLSASVSLFAGQPQQTVQLLETGATLMPPAKQPRAYFLWQSKGTDELLFLGRNSAAQASYEKAAEWASRSSDPQIQSIAKRSRQTAQFLAANPDSRQARVASWFNILTNAIDDSTRQFAVQQITALGGKVSVTEQGALQVKMPKQD